MPNKLQIISYFMLKITFIHENIYIYIYIQKQFEIITMALFKNYLTCYCMMFILNYAECCFTTLKLKKITDSCCVELSHPFIYSHQILESLENAILCNTRC